MPNREASRSRKPPSETTEEEPIRVPAGPPPEVVFSAPTQEETDVSTGTTIRIQFSRDIDQATLKGKIRVQLPRCAGGAGRANRLRQRTSRSHTRGANRVLELKFTKPLERFRTVNIELPEGILGTDGQPLKAWTLTFSIGGS